MTTLVQKPMKRESGATMPAPAGTVPLPASVLVQRPSSSFGVRRENDEVASSTSGECVPCRCAICMHGESRVVVVQSKL